ncbi:MAG: cell wall-binding repeat-containing protein [Clostridium sp.]
MKKSSRVISTLLLGASLTTMSANVFAVETNEIIKEKLAGHDRFETAVKVSDEFAATDNVVLVNYTAIADALAATPLAKMKNAPILLTHASDLTQTTKDQLEKLGTKNVTIVGGETVVSEDVVNELEAMGIAVERISGKTRYATATEVSKAMGSVDKVAVVNGVNGLADALSVAAPAAKEGMAIVLSDGQVIPEGEDIVNGATEKYVIGGETVVSEELANSIGAERLAGRTRNETNAAVLNEFYAETELDKVYVAKDGAVSENQLVDALAAGPLAGIEGNPVMLAGSQLATGQEEYLKARTATTLVEVGEGVNQTAVEAIVKALEVKDIVEEAAEVTKVEALNTSTIKVTLKEASENPKFDITLGEEAVEVTAKEANTDNTVYTLKIADLDGKKGELVVNETKFAFDFSDAALTAAITAVGSATNTDIIEKLQAPVLNLVNIDETLANEYVAEIGASFKETREHLQAAIDRVNAANEEAIKAKVEAVNEANGPEALKTALANLEVNNVIDELATPYYEAIKVNDTTTKALIQSVIDATNKEEVTKAVVKAETTLAAADITNAETLVGKYPAGEDKTGFENRITLVKNIVEVNTQIVKPVGTEDAALETAFATLKIKDVVTENVAAYKEEFAKKVAENKDFKFTAVEEIQAFVTTVNEKVENDKLEADKAKIAAVNEAGKKEGATAAEFNTALKNAGVELEMVETNPGSGTFDKVKNEEDYLNAFKAKVKADSTFEFKTVDEMKELVKEIDKVEVVKDATTVAETKAALVALNYENYMNLSAETRNDIDALVKAYMEDITADEEGLTNVDKVIFIKDVTAVVDAQATAQANLLKAVNDATTNVEIMEALKAVNDTKAFGAVQADIAAADKIVAARAQEGFTAFTSLQTVATIANK